MKAIANGGFKYENDHNSTLASQKSHKDRYHAKVGENRDSGSLECKNRSFKKVNKKVFMEILSFLKAGLVFLL